jgi:hypothetical protein
MKFLGTILVFLISNVYMDLGHAFSLNRNKWTPTKLSAKFQMETNQPMKLTKLAVTFAAAFSISLSANAGWFSSAQQDLLDDISRYQKPVAQLLEQLRPNDIPNAIGIYTRTQLLKGGAEDSTVVYNYLANYINPLQEKMATIAPQLQLPNKEDQQKVETLPLLMKGHILELEQAIKSEKAPDQEREVSEVQETLADFLKLSATKYNIIPYVPNRPLSDKELFGPLSCEFWGKTRIPGSNQCSNEDVPAQ